eukprot:782190_1
MRFRCQPSYTFTNTPRELHKTEADVREIMRDRQYAEKLKHDRKETKRRLRVSLKNFTPKGVQQRRQDMKQRRKERTEQVRQKRLALEALRARYIRLLKSYDTGAADLEDVIPGVPEAERAGLSTRAFIRKQMLRAQRLTRELERAETHRKAWLALSLFVRTVSQDGIWGRALEKWREKERKRILTAEKALIFKRWKFVARVEEKVVAAFLLQRFWSRAKVVQRRRNKVKYANMVADFIVRSFERTDITTVMHRFLNPLTKVQRFWRKSLFVRNARFKWIEHLWSLCERNEELRRRPKVTASSSQPVPSRKKEVRRRRRARVQSVIAEVRQSEAAAATPVFSEAMLRAEERAAIEATNSLRCKSHFLAKLFTHELATLLKTPKSKLIPLRVKYEVISCIYRHVQAQFAEMIWKRHFCVLYVDLKDDFMLENLKSVDRGFMRTRWTHLISLADMSIFFGETLELVEKIKPTVEIQGGEQSVLVGKSIYDLDQIWSNRIMSLRSARQNAAQQLG